MLLLFFILNFGISVLNSWVVGLSWPETKHIGGGARFMAWMGATMAASGFTWCFLVLIGMGANAGGYLSDEYLKGFYELGYTIIIFPILGSGLAITIEAWIRFWRRRTLFDGGVAAYDTFAQIYNMYEAVESLPGVFGHLHALFSRDDDDGDGVHGKLIVLLVVLVAFAAAAGIFLTAFIIRSTARGRAQEQMQNAPSRSTARRSW